MMNFFQRLFFRLKHFSFLRFRNGKLKKYQMYHKMFEHFYFVENVKTDLLKLMLTILISEKNLMKRLPKPVNEYRNFKKLQEDIKENIINYKKVKQFLDSENFPRSFRRQIKHQIDKFIPVFFEHMDFLYDLNHLKKYELFLKFLNKKGLSLQDERNKMLHSKIEEIKEFSKILYIDEKEKVLVAEIPNFEAMQRIQSCWCISRERASWEEYVIDDGKYDNRQIVIWNFSILDTHPSYFIGVTYNFDRKRITHAFDGANDKITSRKKIYKYIHAAYGTKVHNKQ